MSKKTLTQEKLAEIWERCEKATPGPWNVNNMSLQHLGALEIDGNGYKGHRCVAIAQYSGGSEDPEIRPNANFIAHSREDISWLLDRVEELERLAEINKENRVSLWNALALIRQEVEEYGPVVSGEYIEPPPELEAQAIVEGIETVFDKKEAEIAWLREAAETVVSVWRAPGSLRMRHEIDMLAAALAEKLPPITQAGMGETIKKPPFVPGEEKEGDCDSCGKIFSLTDLYFRPYGPGNTVGDGSFCSACRGEEPKP